MKTIAHAEQIFQNNGFSLSKAGIKQAKQFLADRRTQYECGSMLVKEIVNYDEIDWAVQVLHTEYFSIKPVPVSFRQKSSKMLEAFAELIFRDDTDEPDYAFEAGMEENLVFTF